MKQPKGQNPPSTIIVAIPCLNEAITIKKVISDFRDTLPTATIYVFDNNSTDNSVAMAKEAGAKVIPVRRRGKGYVMQAIFNCLLADALLVVDGDDTYFAADALKLIEPILSNDIDMVVGNRLQNTTDDFMKEMHQWGNRVIVATVNQMFGTNYQDILSGYRVFSRRFIQEIPLLTPGFETEMEMTLQALEEGMQVMEIPVQYQKRPVGSESKLKAWYDGYRIMVTSVVILRDHHPLRMFGVMGMFFLLLFLITGGLRLANYFIVDEFIPNTLLSSLVILFLLLGAITLGFGLVLNTINTRFRELRQIQKRKWKNE